MALPAELAALFGRDLTRLLQEISAFGDNPQLWKTTGGVTNSAGHLALHLEGNLREYIGRQLGGVAYSRNRPLEFSSAPVPSAELAERLGQLATLIPRVVAGLTEAQLDAQFPENVLGIPLSTRQFAIHCYAHLSYHLGQIDYLRRVLTGQGALPLAGLEPGLSR